MKLVKLDKSKVKARCIYEEGAVCAVILHDKPTKVLQDGDVSTLHFREDMDGEVGPKGHGGMWGWHWYQDTQNNELHYAVTPDIEDYLEITWGLFRMAQTKADKKLQTMLVKASQLDSTDERDELLRLAVMIPHEEAVEFATDVLAAYKAYEERIEAGDFCPDCGKLHHDP